MYDYIIVGQGIAGTSLAYRLIKAGKNVLVIDPGKENATMVAAGNINPVTGRHYTKSWMIDALLPEAITFYSGLSELLGIPVCREKSIYRPLRSIKEENNWMTRVEDPDYNRYVENIEEIAELEDLIDTPVSYGKVCNALQIDTITLVSAFKDYLKTHNTFLEEHFLFSDLIVESDFVMYKKLKAKQIIFAEGHSVVNNPYFRHLPIEPTKGEVLIIDFDFELEHNLRDKTFISPITKGYWAGSAYEWKYDTELPTEIGKQKIKNQLDSVLKVPYEVIDHKAGIRPCVKDRKPLIGRNHNNHNVIIFNGLGTKGTSLAPYFSKMLVEHLEYNEPILDEVDINRYQ